MTFAPDSSQTSGGASGGTSSCNGSVSDYNGNASITSSDGGFFTGITVNGASCYQAEEVISAFGEVTKWVLTSYSDLPVTDNGAEFRCDGKTGQPSGDPDNDLEEKFSCTDGSETVDWIAPPGD